MRFRFVFFAVRMQIYLLRTEAQRLASVTEDGRLHAESLLIEGARAVDIRDRQHDVIKGFDFH